MASIPKPRLLVILGHLVEEASEQERVAFLGHVPAPARLAYALVGRRKYAEEVVAPRRGITLPAQHEG